MESRILFDDYMANLLRFKLGLCHFPDTYQFECIIYDQTTA